MTLKKSHLFRPLTKHKLTVIKLLLILTLFLFLSLNYRIVKVSGDSMSPSYQDGDYVLVDRFLYQFFPLQRSDLVVFRSLDNLSIKRIKFLPTESVFLEARTFQEQKYEYRLRDDEYYLIGDNQAESHDSRQFGPITKNQIYGKVVLSF